MSITAILLAAGKGTRMNSDLPKCLHEIAGAPMVVHVIRKARNIGADTVTVVVGHGGEALETAAKAYDEEVNIAWQHEQKGTGHAVQMAENALKGDEIALVLYGDTPLTREETLLALVEKAKAINGPAILGFHAAVPGRYGRLIMDGEKLLAIREAKDATKRELEITLCNSGVVAAPAGKLKSYIEKIKNNNASGEYYLTDIVEIARAHDDETGVIVCDESETLGVNTPADLLAASTAFQTQKRAEFLTSGVKMQAPDTVIFSFDTVIGSDANIEPYVVFETGVTVENQAHIRAFSHLEDAHIGEAAVIGPYARLRPGAEIGEGARIGNFVEVKSSQIGNGAKVNHLSYIGNTEIGEHANIGAGTITCNYDGVFKHKTTIGARAFIGSNSALVAPVSIGDDALVGSGSVIVSDVPNEALAVARGRQDTKPGMGKRFMDRLRALKAKAK